MAELHVQINTDEGYDSIISKLYEHLSEFDVEITPMPVIRESWDLAQK